MLRRRATLLLGVVGENAAAEPDSNRRRMAAEVRALPVT
jgi:hypothetical protein